MLTLESMESNGSQEFQWFLTVSSVRVPYLVMKEESHTKGISGVTN